MEEPVAVVPAAVAAATRAAALEETKNAATAAETLVQGEGKGLNMLLRSRAKKQARTA